MSQDTKDFQNDLQEEEEQVFVLKKHNRVVRKVNKQLRKAIRHAQAYNDDLFIELCEQDREAESALEKLWTLGEFDCDPLDYQKIVMLSLAAVEQSKTQAIDQRGSD